MDYSFINYMDESQVRKLISHLDDNLKRPGWLKDLKPVWKKGVKLAKKRLQELQN